MNLLNKLSIISPDDAKRLIDIPFNAQDHEQRILCIQNEIGNITEIKNDIAYKTGFIYKKTKVRILNNILI